MMTENIITNIDIGKTYERNPASTDVHYQSFSQLAAFFGRDMYVHRHDQFFQLHVLETGKIELQLDEQRYSVQAPLFVLTPPGVPHAFFTRQDSDGHVLTVHEHLIWPMLEALYPGTREACSIPALCLSLANQPEELKALVHYWKLISQESHLRLPGYQQTLSLLVQALFTLLLRKVRLQDHTIGSVRGELKLFSRFNLLVDQQFHQHWTVTEYSKALLLTESRLTDICRRFANCSPKRLILDRQLREARRLLLFSDFPVNEIAYRLGFKDPAYFTRFFNRAEGCPPSVFRIRQLATCVHNII